MIIDLTSLNNGNVDYIDISNTYTLSDDYISNSDIIRLDDVIVNGIISFDEENSLHIKCSIKGTMIIPDSISLDEVSYEYEINYDDIVEENCKKGENSLDIFQFLWENIVLEVPLRFTKVKDLSKFHGDGWKLVQEDEPIKSNNPFSDLLKDYDKE